MLTLLLGAGSIARAVDTDGQEWTPLTAQGHVAERWRLSGEVQPRVRLPTFEIDRLVVRAAVGYDLASWASAWLGYAWTPTFGGGFHDEHRPYGQMVLTHRPFGAGDGTLVNRLRAEERFSAGVDLSWFTRFSRPLFDGSDWSWTASDELIGNLLATDGTAPRLDQNRFSLGLACAFGPVTVEGAYIDIYAWRGPDRPDLLRHVAQLSAALSLP